MTEHRFGEWDRIRFQGKTWTVASYDEGPNALPVYTLTRAGQTFCFFAHLVDQLGVIVDVMPEDGTWQRYMWDYRHHADSSDVTRLAYNAYQRKQRARRKREREVFHGRA